MSYRCPVCITIFGTNNAFYNHLMKRDENYSKHLRWIQKHHIDINSRFTKTKDGEVKTNRTPLKDIIEKECKIKE